MRTIPVLVGVILFAGCEPRQRPVPAGALSIADTLLQPSNPQSGGLTDLAVDGEGLVYVTDAAQATVLVVDSSGAIVRQIGRRGNGPGELQQPRNVFASGDTVRVADAAGDQVHVFAREGRYVRSVHGFWGLALADLAIAPDGRAVAAQHGRNGVLALRVGPDGEPDDTLARTDHPLTLGFDFQALKKELRDGHVPEALLTYTGPAIAADGSAWVVHLVAGRVDRYSVSDSLLWSISLPDTVLTRLREGLFERTRRDTTRGFTFPNALGVARPMGDTLWVLLRGDPPGTTTIARIDPRGAWLAPIHIGGTGDVVSFAVDSPRHRLFLLDRGEGTVISVRLPARHATD